MTARSATRLVRPAHAVLTTLLTTVVVANPGGRRRQYAEYHTYVTSFHRLDSVMRRVAPPLFLTTIGAGMAAAAVEVGIGRGNARTRNRARVTAGLRALAAGLVAGAVRTTLRINDPVNRRMREWDPDVEPADWRTQRARWDDGHRIRARLMTASALATATAAFAGRR